jgi:hypothetical protein
MLTAAPKLVPVNRVPSSNRRVASRGAGPPLVTFRHMLAHCCSYLLLERLAISLKKIIKKIVFNQTYTEDKNEKIQVGT